MKPDNTSRKLLIETSKKGLTNQEDIDHAITFIDYYSTVQKLSNGSKAKYHYCLKAFLTKIKELGFTAQTLNEKGVLELMQWVQDKTDWSEDTRADYYDRFTRWWSWCADRAEDNGSPWDKRAYKLLADPRHKKPYKIDRNRQKKKGILSPEQMLKIVNTEHNLCYKAFFSVLYESGMRAGEAFSLLIRDVEAHDNGTYTLHVRRSKTIKRPIPLMGMSVNYLRKWLSQHPSKDDDDAVLWLCTSGTPLNHFSANKELKRLMRVLKDTTEKVSLHSCRHSRATELAGKGLTEFELCRLFGWKVGSKMPATYIREGALDVRTALRRASGMSVEEREIKPVGRNCLQCEHLNGFELDYCDCCGLPLDAKEFQKVRDSAGMHELLKNYAKELHKDILAEVRAELKAISE